MTRKEAAGVIKFEKACVLRQDTPRCNRDCKKCDLLLPTEDVLTAYDMAIKALEQEPCEDTISRQAAIEAIVNTVSEIGLHDNSEVARYGAAFRQHEIIDIIEGVPSAQPGRKKGKWIYHPDWEDDGECPYECSECGMGSDYTTKYCPRCGADMRGEQMVRLVPERVGGWVAWPREQNR